MLPSLKILYEDNHVIVVVKEPGILSQKDDSSQEDLLSNVKEYLRISKNKPGEAYCGLVHRLDRNVGGVMVFAKTSKAAARLSESIQSHTFSKKYYAIVEGTLNQQETWTNFLIKSEKNHIAKVVSSEVNGAKKAELSFTPIKNFMYKGKQYTWVDVALKTGRFHQIRAQFSAHGHPIYGDIKYQGEKAEENFIALWSYSLSFPHPTLQKTMNFTYNPYGNIWENII